MTIADLRKSISDWKFTKEKAINFSIGVIALLLLEFIARPIYRPYIYKNGINDFHVADTLGNTLGVVAAIFILLAIFANGRKQHLSLIKTVTIAMVIYELGQPLLGNPIDPRDIIATIATGGLCLLLYGPIHSIKPNTTE
jgi:hypothetical protein